MKNLPDIALVFGGGGLGSVVRFLLGRWVSSGHTYNFPYGTLIVNVVACFFLGFVVGLADHRQIISPASRLFWTVGFCGGFSTFSTFSAETLNLIQGGFHFSSFTYVISSLVLCLAATLAGIYLAGNS
ncbi:putative fluoride ion transporter CrcB [Cytophagales bacterium WSM2-2]|nr:putative fluoride ion transporter CrcB [Cytophagales bacterium WSM2-2]